MASQLIDEANKLLKALPEGPWRFEPVENSTGVPSQTRGSIRNNRGNVISPVPESGSTVQAEAGVLAAFAQVPELIKALTEELESYNSDQ